MQYLLTTLSGTRATKFHHEFCKKRRIFQNAQRYWNKFDIPVTRMKGVVPNCMVPWLGPCTVHKIGQYIYLPATLFIIKFIFYDGFVFWYKQKISKNHITMRVKFSGYKHIGYVKISNDFCLRLSFSVYNSCRFSSEAICFTFLLNKLTFHEVSFFTKLDLLIF